MCPSGNAPIRWNAAVRLNRTPSCPSCRCPLRQDTWFVREEVVFCNRVECFMGERAAAAVQLLKESFERGSAEGHNGLTFWCPKDPNHDLLTRQLDAHEYPRIAD